MRSSSHSSCSFLVPVLLHLVEHPSCVRVAAGADRVENAVVQLHSRPLERQALVQNVDELRPVELRQFLRRTLRRCEVP
jgi:hypothetical protein